MTTDSETGLATAPELRPMEKHELKVFISHRHEDADIAEIIENQFLVWGFSNEQIHRSSRPGGGPRAGSPLTKEVKDFLFECQLVIFVYTVPDANWKWCFYEIGVAEEPTHHTRVVTFQVLEQFQPMLQDEDRKVVKPTEDGIKDFVTSLHRQDDFFPGWTALTPGYEQKVIDQQAKALCDELCAIARDYADALQEPPVPRWAFVKLEIAGSDMEKCLEMFQEEERIQEGFTQLSDSLWLAGAGGWGLDHFGFYDHRTALKDQPSFTEMVQQWAEAVTEAVGAPEADASWTVELLDELLRSRKNMKPRLSWRPFRSANQYQETPGFVYPVMTTIYKLPGGGRRYDVHMFIMPSA